MKLSSQQTDPGPFREAMSRGTVRTAGLLRAQSGEALKAIRSSVRQKVSASRKGEGIELPMPALLASAVKP
ncbi:MAG: hypothetical protein A3F84_07000 [Candidatus Handelsmanbacteria bacterium RIFCSPLOWO2_12_FULL_64_10]|uniref:Uncharacterized protein n=1 Tax=Handelsmanbacteria sp. (strain RIFCSPLOWO2_12_FULL_64_10) TaxID=1817868 RepID=A0A1F6CD06_HANXR|nr:MAG: hypothetical protein A3F84_07000 [Candidatus Handelsmanbacteria bacterium RIFCSPLOWO2_12_FULL_64_10]